MLEWLTWLELHAEAVSMPRGRGFESHLRIHIFRLSNLACYSVFVLARLGVLRCVWPVSTLSPVRLPRLAARPLPFLPLFLLLSGGF